MTLKTQCALCAYTNAAGWPSDARCPGCGRHDTPHEEPQGTLAQIPFASGRWYWKDADQWQGPFPAKVDAMTARDNELASRPQKHRDHDTRGCGKWCADA